AACSVRRAAIFSLNGPDEAAGSARAADQNVPRGSVSARYRSALEPVSVFASFPAALSFSTADELATITAFTALADDWSSPFAAAGSTPGAAAAAEARNQLAMIESDPKPAAAAPSPRS